jgi:hypothetical protein
MGGDGLKPFQGHFTQDLSNCSERVFRRPKHPIRDFPLQHSEEPKVARTLVSRTSRVWNTFKHFNADFIGLDLTVMRQGIVDVHGKSSSLLSGEIHCLSLIILGRFSSMKYF